MIQNCSEDHLNLTTPFCPKCGIKNSTPRESGEIKQLINFIGQKIKSSSTKKHDNIAEAAYTLLTLLTSETTLKWCLGEIETSELEQLIMHDDHNDQ